MEYNLTHIILKPFDPKTIYGNYREWMNDPIVNQYNSHGLFPKSENDINSFVEQATNSKDNIVWNIYLKRPQYYITEDHVYYALYQPIDASIKTSHINDTHIGNISLQSINFIYRSAELAILLGEKEIWGKGYGTEACKQVIEHGFLKLGLNRIWSGTAAPNIGMQRIFEKVGMKREGIFREGMLVQGKLVDIYEYAILKSDWMNKVNE